MAARTDVEVEPGTPATSGALLVTTKLARPPARVEQIRRDRLVGVLRAGTRRKLTLVAAPPGFGKTTLLAEWLETDPRSSAWLWLDEADNDPARFFAYAIESLRTVDAGLGTQALAALRAPGAGLTEVALPSLINELTGLDEDRELVLVLDDYHVITNPEVHAAVAYLVERLPRSLRLVIASREDPPLPLARLRARAELCELRADELRFTAQEARAFLNETLAVGLSDADVDRLRERTEGWPAALYLAALSLREQADRSAFVAEFAGDDRHVVDYLSAEVLEGQPADVRAFLVETSILERFCGELCDAVRERDDSTSTLEQLERSNLLLVPLDSKREWFRYHQLFADLLREELRRSDAARLPALHRRASAWYRDAGLIIEAARHATAAGDVAAAVDLFGSYWPVFFEQGQLVTVAGWLQGLPRDAFAEDWPLGLAAANVMTHLHRLDEAERWLELAATAPQDLRDGHDPAGPIASQRAGLRLFRGDLGGAIASARDALAAPSEPAGWRVVAQLVLGASLWWAGEASEAAAVLDQAVKIAETAGSRLGMVCALGFRAAIELDDGDTAQAKELAQRAVELTSEAGLEGYPFTSMARVVLGKAHARAGDVTVAREEIEAALKLAEREDSWLIRTYGLLALAEVYQRQGDAAAARRLLAQARATLEAQPDPGIGPTLLDRTERMLKLTPTRRGVAGTAAFWELSERELAVLRLFASKLSQREIAAELYVSFNTVKTHTRAIFRKLGVASRAEAVSKARELGLL